MNETLSEIISFTFQSLLIAYLLLLLLEQIKAGFASSYLNLNYALVLVIIFGALTIFFPYEKKEKFDPFKTSTKPYHYIVIIALGVLGGIIIFYKTKELKWLGYLISAIAAILIILLSLLVLEENE